MCVLVIVCVCVSMCVGLDDALDTGRPGHVFNECVCKVEVTEEVLARNRKRTTTAKQKQSEEKKEQRLIRIRKRKMVII